MKVLYDTSVLVAGMVEAHPLHSKALAWLHKAKAGEHEMLVSAHTLLELYAVLTRLPVWPRISPEIAWRLVKENVRSIANVFVPSLSDYEAVLSRLAELKLTGGAAYDALIGYAALKEDVDILLTFNTADFCRIYPELKERIKTP